MLCVVEMITYQCGAHPQLPETPQPTPLPAEVKPPKHVAPSYMEIRLKRTCGGSSEAMPGDTYTHLECAQACHDAGTEYFQIERSSRKRCTCRGNADVDENSDWDCFYIRK